jgi:hypothetical protein
MSAHAIAVLAAIERAESRRMVARSAPHYFVPMPDGRCNLCSLRTIGPLHLLDERFGLVASVRAERGRRLVPRLALASPQRNAVLA